MTSQTLTRGIDWFAGKGGYTAAMRAVGIEVVGACERDMAKRAAYVEAHGVPTWYSDDAFASFRVPDAEVWTACAAVPHLLRWLDTTCCDTRTWRWLVMETVTRDWSALADAAMVICQATTWLPAWRRGFVVVGPGRIDCAELPLHDGQGPESDPEALDLVLRAIVEAR